MLRLALRGQLLRRLPRMGWSTLPSAGRSVAIPRGRRGTPCATVVLSVCALAGIVLQATPATASSAGGNEPALDVGSECSAKATVALSSTGASDRYLVLGQTDAGPLVGRLQWSDGSDASPVWQITPEHVLGLDTAVRTGAPDGSTQVLVAWRERRGRIVARVLDLAHGLWGTEVDLLAEGSAAYAPRLGYRADIDRYGLAFAGSDGIVRFRELNGETLGPAGPLLEVGGPVGGEGSDGQQPFAMAYSTSSHIWLIVSRRRTPALPAGWQLQEVGIGSNGSQAWPERTLATAPNGSDEARDPAAAYDPVTDRFAVVWTSLSGIAMEGRDRVGPSIDGRLVAAASGDLAPHRTLVLAGRSRESSSGSAGGFLETSLAWDLGRGRYILAWRLERTASGDEIGMREVGPTLEPAGEATGGLDTLVASTHGDVLSPGGITSRSAAGPAEARSAACLTLRSHGSAGGSETRAPLFPSRGPTPVLDTDLDGIPDGSDDCPTVFDPDQLDFDHDGSGDACDADDDNDGVDDTFDCAPLDPMIFGVPGPLGSSLRVDRSGTMTWNLEADASAYNVYRGRVTSGSPWSYVQSCLALGLEANVTNDTSSPGTDELYYYLVTKSNCFGEGDRGADSSGHRRPSVSGCADADGDHVPDDVDNCPIDFNPSQADFDHDGTGDACQCSAISCDDGNDCTQDVCEPLSGHCHHAFAAAGTACGDPAQNECTAPDTCDGSGSCLSNNVPDGAPCVHLIVECMNQDRCLAGSCHAYGAKPMGTPCGDPTTTDCSGPDVCNGQGTCSPNDMPAGTPCGAQGNECAPQDTCSGTGTCIDRGFVPAGTPCDDGNPCTILEACDGSGLCADGLDLLCLDGNPCTEDSCDPIIGCKHTLIDKDGDGVCDLRDNCPSIPNQGQPDSDADGVGDACDNCPLDPNPDQANADNDPLGDVCELRTGSQALTTGGGRSAGRARVLSVVSSGQAVAGRASGTAFVLRTGYVETVVP